MYGEFFKWHISQLVAPIEALFVASPLGFGGLQDVNFCREVILPEVIEEKATANSKRPYYNKDNPSSDALLSDNSSNSQETFVEELQVHF